jgi:hypothetical protein
MFGLALVVVSIGFNTSHWPVVWQGVGSAMEPAASPADAAPRSVALPQQPAAPPVQVGVKPVPDAEKTTETTPAPVQTSPPADAAPAVDENAAPPGTKPEMPLVPVPQIRTVAGSSVNAGVTATIRRLPPVEPSASVPAVRNTASPSGSIPMYPSTGIE